MHIEIDHVEAMLLTKLISQFNDNKDCSDELRAAFIHLLAKIRASNIDRLRHVVN